MSKPFDAATKRLIEADPLAWVHFFGLPVLIGGKRCGQPDADTQARLEGITSLPTLENLAARLFDAASWQELLTE